MKLHLPRPGFDSTLDAVAWFITALIFVGFLLACVAHGQTAPRIVYGTGYATRGSGYEALRVDGATVINECTYRGHIDDAGVRCVGEASKPPKPPKRDDGDYYTKKYNPMYAGRGKTAEEAWDDVCRFLRDEPRIPS